MFTRVCLGYLESLALQDGRKDPHIQPVIVDHKNLSTRKVLERRDDLWIHNRSLELRGSPYIAPAFEHDRVQSQLIGTHCRDALARSGKLELAKGVIVC